MARVTASAVDIGQGRYTVSIPTGATAIQITVSGSSGSAGGDAASFYGIGYGGSGGNPKIGTFQFVNNSARTLTMDLGISPETRGMFGQGGSVASPTTTLVGFERYFSPTLGLHFYTDNAPNEYIAINNYQLENSNYFYLTRENDSSVLGTVPLYRFFQTNAPGDHLFTLNAGEVSGNGWVYEGIVGYVWPPNAPGANTSPIYRKYNGVDHLLTTDRNEGSGSYALEGDPLFYAVTNSSYSTYPIGPPIAGGGGGYGGRALSVVDSQTGNMVIVSGGGGGGGGARSTGEGGGNGGDVGSYAVGTPGSLGVGGTGTTSNDGGGGGGGGGNAAAVGAGGGVRGGGGAGGSRYRSAEVTLLSESQSAPTGSSTFSVTYEQPAIPTISSFTASPSAIINGASSSLTWSYTNATSASINQGVGVVTSLPNKSVSPTTNTTYTLTVTGPGGDIVTRNVTVTVYQRPVLSLTLDNSSIINGGGGTTLRWSWTGDATTVIWSSGGITNGNNNSNSLVNPSTTTTYTGTASGLGGNSTPVSVTLTVYQLPTFSMTLSKNPVRRIDNETVRLTWSATNATSISWTSGGITTSGVSNFYDIVAPTTTTTYSAIVSGPGGTASASRTLTVYQPPIFSLTLDNSSIIANQSGTTLRWSWTGDANTLTWSSGGVTNGNNNSFFPVNPSTTTTYTGTVSGNGGTDTKTVILRVNQIPTATLTVPTSLAYGVQGTVAYTSSYSNTTLSITPTYYYDSPTGSVTGTVINLTKPTSAESGPGSSVSGSFPTAISYTTKGPRSVTYSISAVGTGGTASVPLKTVTIIIDEEPDPIIVPETPDAFKDEEPVITPDSSVTSDILLVDDIDIPVEIKANFPIQVSINGSSAWQDLRSL